MTIHFLRRMLVLLLLATILLPIDVHTAASASKTRQVKVQFPSQTYKVTVGSTLNLGATFQPKVAAAYSTDSPKIATVNQQGVVTGKSVGKARITAKAVQKGYEGRATVVVEVTAASDLKKKITFKDPKLEAVIRGIIAKPADDILVQDVLKITKIEGVDFDRYAGGRIQDLTGIEELRNLTSIDLTNNLVSDLSPLSKLTKLRRLDISHNRIRDLSPLATSSRLEELIAYNNFISDLMPLSRVTTLKKLWISSNNVKDISPLRGLSQLESLQATENIIADIRVIDQMTKLTSVRFENNPLLDAGPALRKPYHDDDDVLRQAELAGQAARDVINRVIHPGMTDLEKETAIHDYLLGKITYDLQYFTKKIMTGTDPGGIYGALVEGISVCGGYAAGMQVLGQLAGLDILYVEGISFGGIDHAWNLVKIDGSYVHVDSTWNDSNPWQIEQDNINKRRHFNLSQNRRQEEIYWDTERYPLAKSDASTPSASDYRVKVSLNSETPVTRDIVVWAILDLRWPNGMEQVKTRLLFEGNAAKAEGVFLVPARVPLHSRDVEYTLKYELYNLGTSSSQIGFSRLSDPFLFDGGGIRGSLVTGKMTNLNDALHLTLLKKGSKGTSYSQTESEGMADNLNASWFEMFVQQSFPQPNGADYKMYALRNVSSFTLPAHSAIYVTAGNTTQPFKEEYYNYHYGGNLVVANHTDQPKLIGAKDIEFSLQSIYSDNKGTITLPDGTRYTEKSTGPYIRLIVFDGDFEESVPYKEYLTANKHRFAGEWQTVSHK